MLVDWRGELVLPPYWTEEQAVWSGYFWNKVCSPADHALVIPGYQKIVEPAKWDIEFEDVTVTIPGGEKYTVYTASVRYVYSADILAWYIRYGANDHIWVSTLDIAPIQTIVGGPEPTLQYITWRYNPRTHQEEAVYHDYGWTRIDRPTNYERLSVSAQGRSAAEAKQNAIAIVRQTSTYFDNDYPVLVDGCGWIYNNGEIAATITEEELIDPTGTIEFTFSNMVSATYTPEVYEEVPAEVTYSDCSERPLVEGNYEGQRVGCYEWTKWERIVNYPQPHPGQYWFFYGPISTSVELDLTTEEKVIDGVTVTVYKNVTTDLSDGKLPSGVSLRQEGNVLYYENALEPIQYPYHIYIPAKVTYGWGELNSTMTVTVNPVATIAQ